MKILLVRLSSMGDLIHTLPALTDLARHLPHDKKNTTNTINFTLLEDIGKFHCNCKSSKDEIYEALEYVFL